MSLTMGTYGNWLPMPAVDRLDAPFLESGTKMLATVRGEPAKYWSWREELNLQPVVYKLDLHRFRPTVHSTRSNTIT